MYSNMIWRTTQISLALAHAVHLLYQTRINQHLTCCFYFLYAHLLIAHLWRSMCDLAIKYFFYLYTTTEAPACDDDHRPARDNRKKAADGPADIVTQWCTRRRRDGTLYKTWLLFNHCRFHVGTCKSSDLPCCGNETTRREHQALKVLCAIFAMKKVQISSFALISIKIL